MESELLVVAVDGFFGVEGEGAARLAVLAEGDFDFDVGFLLEGAQCYATFGAVEADIFQLREDACAASDDACDPHEAIEMSLAELAECIMHWKIRDADMDFGMNALVVWVMEQCYVHSNLVEDLEDFCRSIGQEVGKDSLRRRKMVIRDFKRLSVDLTQCANSCAIDRDTVVVCVFGEEGLELAKD